MLTGLRKGSSWGDRCKEGVTNQKMMVKFLEKGDK